MSESDAAFHNEEKNCDKRFRTTRTSQQFDKRGSSGRNHPTILVGGGALRCYDATAVRPAPPFVQLMAIALSDLALNDGLERRQRIEQRRRQPGAGEFRREQSCFMQGHPVQDRGIREQIHVIGAGVLAVSTDPSARNQSADGACSVGVLPSTSVEHRGCDEKRRRCRLLVVAGPLALAAAIDRGVDRAVAGQ